MKTFSIKEALKRGWGIWKENKMLLTLVTICAGILGSLPNPAQNGIGEASFELAFFLISTVVWIGSTKIYLSLEKGESASFRDLFRHLHYFWRYFFASILYSLITVVGLVLLIIPGFYWALKYQFTFMLIIDKDLSIREAFKRSAVITDGAKWKLLGFVCVAALIGVLGFLALGIGLLVALPVVMLAHVSIYRTLSKDETPTQVSPIITPESAPVTPDV